MHIRLIAVGDRQPSWVDEAFNIYAGRMPREWRFGFDTIETARRSKGSDASSAVEAEGKRVLGLLKDAERVVVLDERGRELSSVELSQKLSAWQSAGSDLAFIIGGPDGVSKTLTGRADFRWSLSKLTLPHGLARVLFAEQLYRAWSVSAGHPYHRA